MKKLHITLDDQAENELNALINYYKAEFFKNGFNGNISYSTMIRGCIHYQYVYDIELEQND